MKESEIVGGPDDPTLPDGETEIAGEKFRLCFDFGALAEAKALLRKSGVELNVLRSLDFTALDVDTLPALFFAASHRFQPGLTWPRAQSLINMRTGARVVDDLAKAYIAAMSEPTQNPPTADQTA